MQMPLALKPLQNASAAVRKAQAGPDDEILDRARHENLPRFGGGHHASGDVHGDPAYLTCGKLTLAGVHAASDLDSQCANRVADGQATPNSPRRPIKRGEEAVPCSVHFTATEADNLPSCQRRSETRLNPAA